MSQMMRNKDISWTENWALLLVCILLSDQKCKYSIGHDKFRVFNFRSTLISQNFLNRETHENKVSRK